jgi:argininosuccinate lyase
LMAGMIDNTSVDCETCRAAASDSSLLATDLADYLVRKGVAFRHAHGLVGAAVAKAEQQGKPMHQLTIAELQEINPAFGDDSSRVFDLNHAMAQRNIIGAPGTQQVAAQLERWKKILLPPA